MQIIRNLIKYVLDKIFPQSCFGKKIAAMTDKEQKKPSSPSNLVRVGSGLVNKLALLNPVTGESDEPILVGFEDVRVVSLQSFEQFYGVISMVYKSVDHGKLWSICFLQ